MKKGLKITGAAVGVALMVTAVLGTTVFADSGNGECDTCTGQYAEVGAGAAARGWQGMNGMGDSSMEAVGELLGLTVDEIHELREEGYSLAEIAEANGVTVDELVEAIMTEKEEWLEAKVADGTLTQERAEIMTQNMEQRTVQAVNRNETGPAGTPGEYGNRAGSFGTGAAAGQMRGRGGAGMSAGGNGTCDGTGTGTALETGSASRWGSATH